MRAREALTIVAKQRNPVCVIDIEKKTVPFLQLQKPFDRREAAHRVNTVAHICDDWMLAANLLQGIEIIVPNCLDLRLLGHNWFMTGEGGMGETVENHQGSLPLR